MSLPYVFISLVMNIGVKVLLYECFQITEGSIKNVIKMCINQNYCNTLMILHICITLDMQAQSFAVTTAVSPSYSVYFQIATPPRVSRQAISYLHTRICASIKFELLYLGSVGTFWRPGARVLSICYHSNVIVGTIAFVFALSISQTHGK